MITKINSREIIIKHIEDCIDSGKNILSDEHIAYHTGFSIQTVFRTIHWAAQKNLFHVERCSGRPSVYMKVDDATTIQATG